MLFLGRRKFLDREKLTLIREKLAEFPEGLWVRELARRTELDKSTVSRYLATYLAGEVGFRWVGPSKMVFFRR